MSKMDVDNWVISLFKNVEIEDDEFHNNCKKLSEDIDSSKYTIVQLVEDLQSYLVDTSPDNRLYGTLILSTVLNLIPITHLNSTQLSFITTFYTDRLKDNHKVVPAVLKGILALAKQKNLPEGSCVQLLTSLFHNVVCQQQQQQDRYIIYNIFQEMLICRGDELKSMGIDFAYGVISSIENERDPRNLLFLFNWLPKFLKTINLGHLTEDIFDVLSSYFPIDFRVSSEEAFGISRDSLATALTLCLCAISDFAEFAIPLAIEKLESTLRIAKLDSLNLLNNGSQTFSGEMYLQHAKEIISLIQKDILSNNDPELESICLQTLTSVINKISELGPNEAFKQIMYNIIDTSKANLQPDSIFFHPTSKFLISISKGSKLSAKYITNDIVPLLSNLYNITTTAQHQINLFRILIQLVDAYTSIHQDFNLSNNSELALIPNLCIKAAIDPNLQIRAAGLESLSVITKSLNEELRKIVYENFKIYLTSPQLHESAISCLKSFALIYPMEIKNVIEILNPEGINSLEIYLHSISSIVNQHEFTEIVLKIVMKYCLSIETAFIGCKILKNILEETNLSVANYLSDNNFIETIINFILCHDFDYNFLKIVSEILKMIVSTQNEQQQLNILNQINSVINTFKNDERLILIFVFDGLMSRLRLEILKKLGIDIKTLLLPFLQCDNEIVHLITVELVSNIVNKLPEDNRLESLLNDLNEICERTEELQRKCNLVSWITKALAMRGHESSKNWINKLIDLLRKNEEAAIGFRIVISDSYDSLSPKSFCNRRLLYRQNFFIRTTDVFVDKDNCNNNNFLLAFGLMLEEIPKSIIKMHFDKIIKLIILSLNINSDQRCLIPILTLIKSLIATKDDLSKKYLEEFIPKLLILAQFKQSMKVRMLSLQCLQHYTEGFVLYKLLPYKTDVIQTLEKCLDDHKRLVRKEAAEARLSWYLIDAPI